MSDIIYLDHAAATPVRAEVLAAMFPISASITATPAACTAWATRRARRWRNREQVAGVLGCLPGEIVFTSSGTEADNLALRGVSLARRQRGQGSHIVVSAVEHKGILDTATHLRDFYGFELTVLPVDTAGCVGPAGLGHGYPSRHGHRQHHGGQQRGGHAAAAG